MSDKLFDDLQKLYESNTSRFEAPIMESYEKFEELDMKNHDKDKLDQTDHEGLQGSDDDNDAFVVVDDEPESEISKKEKKPDEDLPMASHSSVFPQPSVADGIIFINPKAIPNDYSKGHIVCVLKVDTAYKKVRVDQLKNGAVHLPFSIIKKDESGREYVTKEDVLSAFNRGAYVWKLLKLQPLSLDRNIESDKFRVQAANPHGETSADLARKSNLPKPGTPEWTAHIAKIKAANQAKK